MGASSPTHQIIFISLFCYMTLVLSLTQLTQGHLLYIKLFNMLLGTSAQQEPNHIACEIPI